MNLEHENYEESEFGDGSEMEESSREEELPRQKQASGYYLFMQHNSVSTLLSFTNRTIYFGPRYVNKYFL